MKTRVKVCKVCDCVECRRIESSIKCTRFRRFATERYDREKEGGGSKGSSAEQGKEDARPNEKAHNQN